MKSGASVKRSDASQLVRKRLAAVKRMFQTEFAQPAEADRLAIVLAELRSATTVKDTKYGCEFVTPKRENAARPAPYRK